MYFSATAGDEDDRARLEALQRRQRPENEAPASVAIDAVLLEGPDTVVLLGNVQAFSTGVAFSITAMTRRPAPPDAGGLGAVLHHYSGGTDSFLLGVEYADGRSISTVANQDPFGADVPADALTLWPTGGGGGSRYAEAAFYLTPLPPPGAVRFIAAWPSRGLPEAVTEISADEILAAAGRARRLWDWEPEPVVPPPAPEVPPGGWFDAHLGGTTD